MPFFGLQGAPQMWEGMVVYPGSGVPDDPWSLNYITGNYQHAQADLLITLMDAWALDVSRLEGMNVAHWQPVDCARLGRYDTRLLASTKGATIAMSRFGYQQILSAGFEAFYAPHALDTSVTWAPAADRSAVRKAWGLDDRFIVGVNSANQDPFRKGFGEMFQAFELFARRHPDAVMLVHSKTETQQGANLADMITSLGMAGRIILGDQYAIGAGIVGDAEMAVWHGGVDVLLNCAWGEGFGLAVLQSQATGTPVIVTDCSAMTELCGSGWLVDGQKAWNSGHSAWWKIPYVADIADALEQAYDQAAGKRDAARLFALGYDSDLVFARDWLPVLRELIPA